MSELARPQIFYRRVLGKRLRIARTFPAGATGPPLLLFNGIGASLGLLESLTGSLRRTRTIVFDLPGIGASDAPRGIPQRPSGLAKLARELLRELDLPEVDVLGVSWGGMLAQQFALQYPSVCRRLVLAATSAGQLMVPASPRVLFHMMTPMRYMSTAYFRRVAPEIYGGDFRADPALIERHSRLMAPPTMLGYLHQLMALQGWTSLFRLHRIAQPTLVLAGEDDPIVPTVNARILAGGIPDAQLHTFDCGHLFLLTRRGEVSQLLTDFLARR